MTFLKWMLAVSLMMGLAGAARADDSGSMMSCLGEVRTVCAGLENDLDHCLNERAGQFSDSCRASLKKMMTSVSTNPGLQSCINDIQSSCPGLDGVGLAQCIESKRAGFSKPCLDYMNGGKAQD